MGFDKPDTIYRGAFSNETALPVWASVIKSTFENYRPSEIERPPGLNNIEICSITGLLACPKCLEISVNPQTGEQTSIRTVHSEMATAEQKPKDICDLHSGIPRKHVETRSAGEWPRAAPVADVTVIVPVKMRSPTVLGDVDPWNSTQALNNAFARRALTGQVAPVSSSSEIPAPTEVVGGEPEVRRAEPVGVTETMTGHEPTIDLEPPPPIDF